jgi:hypothetical protein
MKSLDKFTIKLAECEAELIEFKKLLDGKKTLSERNDILPFFKANRHLAALIGGYHPKIHSFDRQASELSLFGDYTCDLVIGDSTSRGFCFVEFEDASPNSVFTKKKGKDTPEWSRRFEHGFSQIVDWIRILDGQKHTPLFRKVFENSEINAVGLLVIGRRHYLDEAQYDRLLWRSDQVHVGATHIHCITFDELYLTLSLKLSFLGQR